MVKKPPPSAGASVQLLGQEDPLEKETATHSSILAWRIPWTEGPGGLQPVGVQKRHLATKHAQMRDLSSLTRGQTRAPALEGEALASGPPGKPLEFEIKKTMPVTRDPPSQTEILWHKSNKVCTGSIS